MNKKYLIGGGIIAFTIASVILIVRKMGYSNVATAINSAMGNYFTIAELCASTTAKQKGIDNTPTASVKANLQTLINKLLNPIREVYGKPIVVSSGYRCPALNKAVGGVANSQHTTGEAVDIQPTSTGSMKALFEACAKIGGYDQLIIEHTDKAKWIHVSYSSTGKQRGQMMYYNGSYRNITLAEAGKYL